MQLQVVQGKVVNLLLPFAPQHCADRYQQAHDYIVHDVVSLNEHVGVLGGYAQVQEFFFHFLYLTHCVCMPVLQVAQLAVDFL